MEGSASQPSSKKRALGEQPSVDATGPPVPDAIPTACAGGGSRSSASVNAVAPARTQSSEPTTCFALPSLAPPAADQTCYRKLSELDRRLHDEIAQLRNLVKERSQKFHTITELQRLEIITLKGLLAIERERVTKCLVKVSHVSGRLDDVETRASTTANCKVPTLFQELATLRAACVEHIYSWAQLFAMPSSTHGSIAALLDEVPGGLELPSTAPYSFMLNWSHSTTTEAEDLTPCQVMRRFINELTGQVCVRRRSMNNFDESEEEEVEEGEIPLWYGDPQSVDLPIPPLSPVRDNEAGADNHGPDDFDDDDSDVVSWGMSSATASGGEGDDSEGDDSAS